MERATPPPAVSHASATPPSQQAGSSSSVSGSGSGGPGGSRSSPPMSHHPGFMPNNNHTPSNTNAPNMAPPTQATGNNNPNIQNHPNNPNTPTNVSSSSSSSSSSASNHFQPGKAPSSSSAPPSSSSAPSSTSSPYAPPPPGYPPSAYHHPPRHYGPFPYRHNGPYGPYPSYAPPPPWNNPQLQQQQQQQQQQPPNVPGKPPNALPPRPPPHYPPRNPLPNSMKPYPPHHAAHYNNPHTPYNGPPNANPAPAPPNPHPHHHPPNNYPGAPNYMVGGHYPGMGPPPNNNTNNGGGPNPPNNGGGPNNNNNSSMTNTNSNSNNTNAHPASPAQRNEEKAPSSGPPSLNASAPSQVPPVTSPVGSSDGIPLHDDTSQQSTLSQSSDRSDGGRQTPKGPHNFINIPGGFPPPPGSPRSGAPSPGAPVGMPHEPNYPRDMVSPGWQRTAASPVTAPTSRGSDSLNRLFDLDDDPGRRPWLERLLAFMEDKGTPITQCPTISKNPLDLYKLYIFTRERGGFLECNRNKSWKDIASQLGIAASSSGAYTLKKHYGKNLLPFECYFDRGGVDPAPILAQAETSGKKKGKNASNQSQPPPVPSPGSQDSRDSYSGGTNSQDGYPYPGGNPGGPNNYGGYPPNVSADRPPSHPGLGPGVYPQGPPPSGYGGYPPRQPDGYGGPGYPPSGYPPPRPPGWPPGGPAYLGPPNGNVPPSGAPPPGNPSSTSSGGSSGASNVGAGGGDASSPYGSRGGTPPVGWNPANSSSYGPPRLPGPPYPPSSPAAPNTQAPYNNSNSNPQGGGPGYPADQYHQQPKPPSSGGGAPPPPSAPPTSMMIPGPNPPLGAAAAPKTQQPTQPPPPPPPAPSSTAVPLTSQPEHQVGGGRPVILRANNQQQQQVVLPPSPHLHSSSSSSSPAYPQTPNNTGGGGSNSSNNPPQKSYPGPPSSTQHFGGIKSSNPPPVSSGSPAPSVMGANSAPRGALPPGGYPQPYAGQQRPPMYPGGGPPPTGWQNRYPGPPYSSSGGAPDRGSSNWSNPNGGPRPWGGPERPPAPGAYGYNNSPNGPHWNNSMMRPQGMRGGPYRPEMRPSGPGNYVQSNMRHGYPGGRGRELLFPAGSVEATQPLLLKRRKYNKTDIQPVDGWRLVMTLKSGLLMESTWALDALNILLYDDNAFTYFGLSNMPGLLEALLEHWRSSLLSMFDITDDLELEDPTSKQQVRKRGHTVTPIDYLATPERNLKAHAPHEHIEMGKVEQPIDPEDKVTLLTGVNFSKRPRFGFDDCGEISLEREEDALFVTDEDRSWDLSEKSSSGINGHEHWRQGGGNTTKHIVTHYASGDLNLIPFVRVLKDLSKSSKDKKKCSKKVAAAKNESAAINGGKKEILDEAKEEAQNKQQQEEQPEEDVIDRIKRVSGIVFRDPELARSRWKSQCLEDENYMRDEPSLSLTSDSQDSLGKRSLCISTILRNLSFLPGNEYELSKNATFLTICGRLLLLYHWHPPRTLKTRNYDRAEEDDSGESCTSLIGDSEWWWDYLHVIRENVMVALANIAGALELRHFDEGIVRPLLEGLLEWAVSSSAYAQDPFPNVGPHSPISPQRLAIETLCKLSLQEANVDFILSTPPYSRIEKLCRLLAKKLYRYEDQVLREFSINLLYYLSGANSGVARTIATADTTIGLLLGFIEQAEQNALVVAQQHGVNALRDNPDSMGTSLDMLRRAASTLSNLSQHPDNIPLFLRQEQRLLSLVMSQILDQGVEAILSNVLFNIGKASSISSSSHIPPTTNLTPEGIGAGHEK
eukprot:TRINITY_DN1204_c2_g1_i1.p1 TRINITY_DN1204_c2_g1~~TRINITY_DN1204_c2_g1_i1.p1  ORF type:complete len:1779 (+),score=632.85 TRINITY_DN1204_c2_g1_i1:577-5913(+)